MTLNPRVQEFMKTIQCALVGFAMSMPRKAMQELGFQACCVWCDAPDDSSSKRCGPCIQHHRGVREALAAGPPDDPFFQLGKEIMAMAADPHHYDHDEVHGPVLRELQRRAGSMVDAPSPSTTASINEIFEQQKMRKKVNVLQDIGNQNPWKEQPLDAKKAASIGEATWKLDRSDIDEHYGRRTIPSRPIDPVNRDERLGEDTALTDRVHAAASQSDAVDEQTAEIFEAIEFKRRQEQRQELKRALEDVKKMVDDDLDF